LEATAGDIGRRSNEAAEPEDLVQEERNEWVAGGKPLIPAAVLVPLVVHEDGLNVMLTKRTDHLNNHGGQISFPGGRVDDSDRDALHTALRETEEEVGLHSKDIEIIGELDEYIVGTGYLVNPIIGVIEPPFELTLHEGEVAEVFEVPLEFLITPENMKRHAREFEGIKRHYFAITWEEYFIWGATAGMLRNLSQRLLVL
jgi:8-oxo-dGTP pyrophosphatase MutT (NUDIX family)|tara:strand:- start:44 stop:643 length:600 start_codon:yes stop_codon:yes gene_type:complete